MGRGEFGWKIKKSSSLRSSRENRDVVLKISISYPLLDSWEGHSLLLQLGLFDKNISFSHENTPGLHFEESCSITADSIITPLDELKVENMTKNRKEIS